MEQSQSPRFDSLSGKNLDEYRLEELLGRGGMARVYRGVDVRLNRSVAIKVIDSPYRSDAAYLQRFLQEAQAIARLDHPNVVRLYRYGEVDGLLYMAMQYIEGANLAYVIDSYQRDGSFIEPAEILRITGEVGAALDYIHSQGIIHRDVKPSNIMLTSQSARAILTDFGLALQQDVGTIGSVFGSPHYIAPEQARSSANAVAQSDLYALGVILYEMFTNRLPFTARDPLDIAMMHLNSAPPLPCQVRPDLPAGVEAVILRAMAKQPEERFQTGRALAQALEDALRSPEGQAFEQAAAQASGLEERVTRGFAAAPQPRPIKKEPLPTLHVHEPPPSTLPAPEPAPRRRTTWLAVALAVTGLLFIACLVMFGMAFADKFARQPAASLSTPAGAGLPGAPTAAIKPSGTPAARSTAAPTSPPPTPTTALSGPQELLLARCPEEGCMVLVNQGDSAFALKGLVLKSKEASLRGEEWGISELAPGGCVRLFKDESWVERLPSGLSCAPAGHPLMREGPERFWKDSFSIEYGGVKIADCKKNADRCEVVLR